MLTGQRAVRRRERGDDRAQAGQRGAGAAEPLQPRRPGAARGRGAAGAGQGPGRALRRRRRVHRRARGRARARSSPATRRRRSRPRRSPPSSRRPSPPCRRRPRRRPRGGRRDRRATSRRREERAAGLGRGRCSSALLVVAAIVGALFLTGTIGGKKVKVPNVVGHRPGVGGDGAAPRRASRSTSTPCSQRQAQGHRHQPGPGAGHASVKEGATVSARSSRRARATTQMPVVDGLGRSDAAQEAHATPASRSVHKRDDAATSIAKDHVHRDRARRAARQLEVGAHGRRSSSPTARRDVEVPDVTGQPLDEARATLEDAGFKVDTTDQETRDEEPGTVLAQTPARRQRAPKGSTVTLTVAKEPPEIDGPGRDRRDDSDALTTCRTPASRSATERSRRRRRSTRTASCSAQDPGGRQEGQARQRRDDHRRPLQPDLDPEGTTPTPRTPTDATTGPAMRVVVLCGGRSSEHDVSLTSGARGRRRACARRATTSRSSRSAATARWRHERRRARAAPGRGPARRRRRVPGAARAVRRGRHGPGRARDARRRLRRLRRHGQRGVHGQAAVQGADGPRGPAAGRAIARADAGRRPAPRLAVLGQAGAARARRSASRASSAPTTSPPRSREALEHDPRVIVEAHAARPGGRVLGARARPTAPRASQPGEIVLRSRAPAGTTTRPSTPRAAWSSSSRRGSPTRPRERVRTLAVEAFTLAGCSGLARVDFFVDGDDGAAQRAQHDAGPDADERLREAVGGGGHRLPRPAREAVPDRRRPLRGRARVSIRFYALAPGLPAARRVGPATGSGTCAFAARRAGAECRRRIAASFAVRAVPSPSAGGTLPHVAGVAVTQRAAARAARPRPGRGRAAGPRRRRRRPSGAGTCSAQARRR